MNQVMSTWAWIMDLPSGPSALAPARITNRPQPREITLPPAIAPNLLVRFALSVETDVQHDAMTPDRRAACRANQASSAASADRTVCRPAPSRR